MKRLIAWMILISSLLLSVSCAGDPKPPGEDPQVSGGETTGVQMPEHDVSSPNEKAFHFQSYEALLDWMTRAENGERDNGAYGLRYMQSVALLRENRSAIRIPFLRDGAIPLRQGAGDGGITFFSSELYGLPWIWYFCEIDGKEIAVKTACLVEEEYPKLNEMSASITVRNFSETAPNTDNRESFPHIASIEESIYEIGSREVSVLTYQRKDEERVTYSFAYDGMLICIVAEPDHLPEHFWAEFAMLPYPE